MRDFTTTYSRRDVAFFIVPVIISELAQEFCSLITTGVISRTLTYEAIAVRGALSGFQSLQHYIFVDMMIGFGVYIMRCIGTKDKKKIAGSFGGAAWFAIILGLLMILLGLFAVHPLLGLANVPDELRADAAWYLRLLLFGSGVLGLKNLFYVTIQGSGESLLFSIVNALGIVTHMLLIVFLIVVAHFGVEAAALAVLLNNAWQCVVFFIKIRRDPDLAPSLSPAIFADAGERRELVTNGFSKAGMTILIGIGGFLMQRALNGLSVERIAAYSYSAGTLNGFFMQPLGACATTAQVCAAQSFGAKRYSLMRTYVSRMIRLGFVFSAVFVLVSYLFGGQMITMLAGGDVPGEVIRAGRLWLMLCTPVYPLLTMFFICRNCVQVAGGYWQLQLFGCTELAISLVFALVLVPHFGYPAVCVSVMVKWAVCGLLSYGFYRKRMERFDGKRGIIRSGGSLPGGR